MVASTFYESEIGVAVVYPTLNKMSRFSMCPKNGDDRLRKGHASPHW